MTGIKGLMAIVGGLLLAPATLRAAESAALVGDPPPIAVPVSDTLRLVAAPQKRFVRPIAFKTNLLFDAVSVLNVELEVPLARRWSIAGQWIFPWWLWSGGQYALELLYAQVELKYWFGGKQPLTGWFVGLNYGTGLYDVEANKTGYQGEIYLSAGVSAGYSKPLSRSCNIEFSLGVGYIESGYRSYHAVQNSSGDWRLIKQSDGRFSYFGINQAKISLVWHPHFAQKNKR